MPRTSAFPGISPRMRSFRRPRSSKAVIAARKPGRIAGLPIAEAAFRRLDPGVTFDILINDGGDAQSGDHLAEIDGNTRAILQRGANCAQLPRPSERRRHPHPRLREGDRGHECPYLLHAQDDAGPARLREICGAHGRRHEPPLRPVRRRADQRQPYRGGGRASARPSSAHAVPSGISSRSRSRSTGWISSKRRCDTRSMPRFWII